MNLSVSLNDLHFHSHIGVFNQEKTVGNEFVVNLTVTLTPPDKIDDNSLHQMISYADLYEIVKFQMSLKRDLLETVAYEIILAIKKRWSNINSGKISIAKLTPPIPNIQGFASITLSF